MRKRASVEAVGTALMAALGFLGGCGGDIATSGQGDGGGPQEAIGDETEHARLAFALASAYAGADMGPGALAIDGSLDGFDVVDLVATLLREGCIGETVAAIEARDALESAYDPVVRGVLETIARDELRHAELAWRTLGWLVASGRVSPAAGVRRLFCAAAARRHTASRGPPRELGTVLPIYFCGVGGLTLAPAMHRSPS